MAAFRGRRIPQTAEFDRLVEGRLNRSRMAVHDSRLAFLDEPITPFEKY